MTSDGISTADWQQVHELAVAAANAADGGNCDAARDALLSFLRELRARYGERPSILATEADYAGTPQESQELLLRAFRLATEMSDTSNLKEISLSLAEHYVTQLRDLSEARRWLTTSRQWVDPANDVDWEEFDALDRAIAKGLK